MRLAPLALTLAVACSEGERPADPVSPEPTETSSETPSETGAPTGTGDTAAPTTPDPGDPALLALDPLVAVNNGRFATSLVCAECHANSPSADAMRDAAGRDVGMFDLWQASMMANAGRDPLWRAAVSAEVAATPAAAAAIQEKCTRCHTPMAATDAALAGDPPTDLSTLTGGGDRMHLALDGVSCAACHQIEPTGLGTDASFTGGYTILGQGRIYGPHADPFGNPMEMQTGFTPVASNHVRSAGLCGSCHQQEVHTLAPDGSETGTVVAEQAVYAEWQNSFAGAAGITCADCHLPLVDEDGQPISTAIARQPSGGDFMGMMVGDRQPYGRHVLVGGNTLVPQILRDQAAILQPTASAAAFDAKIAAARAQLAEQTATLAVVDPAVDGDSLGFTVEILPLTGHRFPTGIPVRRAWLHVTVTDGAGAVVFSSGAWDADGRILDGAGGVLASEAAGGPVAPHLDLVEAPDQVVVYEAVLADVAGAPVWRLTRGAGWYKDNRLLPQGWDPAHPEVDWATPAGVAGDPDYDDAGDRVTFAVPLGGAAGPFTVTAELVYQPLSTRWAEELFATGTPEALAFRTMWAAADRSPEPVADDTVTVP